MEDHCNLSYLPCKLSWFGPLGARQVNPTHNVHGQFLLQLREVQLWEVPVEAGTTSLPT